MLKLKWDAETKVCSLNNSDYLFRILKDIIPKKPYF